MSAVEPECDLAVLIVIRYKNTRLGRLIPSKNIEATSSCGITALASRSRRPAASGDRNGVLPRQEAESLFHSVVPLMSSVRPFSDKGPIDVAGSKSLSFERALAKRDITVPTGHRKRPPISR
jgi:hypothetical protein